MTEETCELKLRVKTTKRDVKVKVKALNPQKSPKLLSDLIYIKKKSEKLESFWEYLLN